MFTVCNPLATVADMCCVDEHTAEGAETELSTRLDEWIADPGQPFESYTVYSQAEYDWLVLAQDGLESATDFLVRKTCGLPQPPCTTTFRNMSCGCGCGGSECVCGALCIKLPKVIGIITDATVKIWDVDGDPNIPDRTLTLGVDFFLTEPTPGEFFICPYEGADSWPTSHWNKPLGDAETWALDITHGQAVVAWVREAAADWACVATDRCLPAEKCGDYVLPDHTVRVGDIVMLTIVDYQERGLTGIRSMDHVLSEFSCAKYGYSFSDPAESSSPFERHPLHG